MGKDWDKFKVGENIAGGTTGLNTPFGRKRALPAFYQLNNSDLHAFQQFTYEWATELYRVMKPGAHILVFGGTRTYHRMACGVEDAGFECRDMVEWIYGCLSEDTEILVDGKWEHYNKNIYKHHALCYNIEKDELYQGEIQRVFEYEYDDTAYQIKSAFTDQIVSRNHRCVVERGGRKVFTKAETLERQEDIPFLESVSKMQEAFSYSYKGTSDKKEVLFSGMFEKRVSRKKNRHSVGRNGREKKANLLNMWQYILSEKEGDSICEKAFLLSKMLWEVAFRKQTDKKTSKEYQRFGKKWMDGGKQEILSREYERCKQSCMERWCNLFQNAWKLCWREICEVSLRVYGDGSQRWLCNGASPIGRTGVKKTFEEDGGSASQRPRPNQQFINQSSTIREQPNTQTLRERSGCRTTLATITPFHYKGVMWCVEVPTGAFVARRNGKIFITGNSGFPKSLDISKQLDKMAGEEREVVGQNSHGVGSWMLPHKQKHRAEGGTGIGYADGSGKEFDITAPTSEEAISYNGFGTSLKPSHEPILLARKPISERNIAANVLRWGTGGINIGKCRINHNENLSIERNEDKKLDTNEQGWGVKAVSRGNEGRYPSNLLLECCCEDDELVEGTPETIIQISHAPDKGITRFAGDIPKTTKGYSGGIAPTHTNPLCVCRMLDEQSGELKSGDLLTGHKRGSGISSYDGGGGIIKANYGGDKGGASRFYYQAKASQNERWFYCTICKKAYPMKERDKHTHNAPEETKYKYLEFHPTQKPESLISYLMRLITPPNGTTIDPFLGSGTAIIAAEREGFNCVGIDSKPEYCEIGYVRGKAELIQQKISGKQSVIEREGF